MTSYSVIIGFRALYRQSFTWNCKKIVKMFKVKNPLSKNWIQNKFICNLFQAVSKLRELNRLLLLFCFSILCKEMRYHCTSFICRRCPFQIYVFCMCYQPLRPIKLTKPKNHRYRVSVITNVAIISKYDFIFLYASPL